MLVFLAFLVFSPAIVFLITLIPFQFLKLFKQPKLDRDWDGLHKLLPEIVFSRSNKDEIFVRNIRDAKYNPNYEFENRVSYLNKKYNINDIEKVWIMVNPYGPFQTHVLLSFQFGEYLNEASFLTASYEPRRIRGKDFEVYHALYKTFEGLYIFALEEDTFFVRTNVRKADNLYLYPLNIEKEKSKELFKSLIEDMNNCYRQPFFYKIWTRNCLTEIFKHLKKVGILDYTKLDARNVNALLEKYKLVDSPHKYKISFNKDLQADELYSIKVRENILKNLLVE
jgi:hypothetical protein